MREKRLYFNISEINMLLIISSLFSVGLVFGRIVFTLEDTYISLIWNLFLAWAPYILSYALNKKFKRSLRNIIFFPWIMLWLLFFPNASYIITDLIHLSEYHGAPKWYDLILILSFVLNGMLLSGLSMLDIHEVIIKRNGERKGWVFTIFVLFTSGFGVYIGRYLRWNSWDVFTQTIILFNDIKFILFNPLQNAKVYAFTIVFSSFHLLFYLMMVRVSRILNKQAV